GYLLALMLAIGASCFTFAALVERVIMEYEVKELLQNTARLTALGGMAAEISHEIKNPLTVLSLNNAQMKNKLDQNQLVFDVDYFQNKVEVAEKMLKRLLEIMNTLRSHYNSGVFDNFKQVSINEIFAETQIICDFRAKREGITVTFTSPEEPLLFECRSVQIIQTVQNIIQNAMDELDGVVSPRIEVEASLMSEQHVKITIVDNGRGIDPEIKPYIFDSFFTTKPKEKGSGLGLSISKRFIEEHGGRIYVENSSITKFVIILPVTQVYVENSSRKISAS
ncbi:MAG: HAMP domain-containing histidine kinase, partial [Bdellovibrionaceae bacterium]|nr:HAMP domain-containing histidine kinase [Pseudobdellovibrionaceae bacterium]